MQVHELGTCTIKRVRSRPKAVPIPHMFSHFSQDLYVKITDLDSSSLRDVRSFEDSPVWMIELRARTEGRVWARDLRYLGVLSLHRNIWRMKTSGGQTTTSYLPALPPHLGPLYGRGGCCPNTLFASLHPCCNS